MVLQHIVIPGILVNVVHSFCSQYIIFIILCFLGRVRSLKANEETKVYDDALVINTKSNIVYGLSMPGGIQTAHIEVSRFASTDSDGEQTSSNGVYEDINDFRPAESTAL